MMPEMTAFSSDGRLEDHHGEDSHSGETPPQLNENEDQHQPQPSGGDERTSHHRTGSTSGMHGEHIGQLCEAAKRGDWDAAEKIEREHEGVLFKVISKDRNETAFHIATRSNKAAFVKKLMNQSNFTKKDLEVTNICKNTALCIAATLGNIDIAKSMVEKHPDLVRIRGSGNATPAFIAAGCQQNDMVSYLLGVMDINEKMELLLSAISSDHYDIALLILEDNEFSTSERYIKDNTPLHIMAQKSNAIIGTKNTPTYWQESINKCFKHIYKKEMMQTKARKTVELMWKSVSDKSRGDELRHFILHPSHPSSMLHNAATVGNIEFLRILLNTKPELLWEKDKSGKNIFHVAVENRQRGVFDLINDMKLLYSDDLSYVFDEEKIGVLKLVATKKSLSHLDQASGAFFQMHQELLWFKEVENMVECTTRTKISKETAQELFTEKHKELVKEGEKWVKNTASSCMLVATLIATVVFAAAFTVPGGNNDNTGSPMFLNHRWFTVFLISDSIALMSSSTAILLFLSISTSRCGEKDFMFWLPLELVLGLGFLFLSVLGMVLAFSACLFLHYGKDIYWIPLLITWTATVPIYWFCILQWKLWTDGLVALHATGMSCLFKIRKNKVFYVNNGDDSLV